MALTRRNLLGAADAVGSAGLAASLFQMGNLSKAFAQTPAAAVNYATWTGTVAHATHYGPFIASVKNGRLEK